MATNDQLIDLEQFELVANECKRWSKRSLSVVRMLLIDEKSPSEVAAAFNMKPEQARVLRVRFLDKAEKVRVAQFMENEEPKKSIDEVLERFSSQILELHDSGYTPDQIKRYLVGVGVTTTLPRIRDFLKSLEGEK